MNFISETKFNAPIKGCLPSNQGNSKGDLRIDSNLQLLGNLCEDGSFSVSEGIQVGGKPGDAAGVTIGRVKGYGDFGEVRGRTADFDNGAFDNLNACCAWLGGVTFAGVEDDEGLVRSTIAGYTAHFQELDVCSATLYGICSFNELAIYDEIRFTQHRKYGSPEDWTLFNDEGTLRLNGSGSCGGEGGIHIDSRQRGVHVDKLCASQVDIDHITLNGEKITSWSDLTKYVGGGTETNNKIQRFTSPALPANCSKFYFEGDETVTGTELPFIQVRETATGKLFQMDVWVNLDEACTGYTVGKPVAEVEPCTSTIDAGKWTAIVMN